MKPLTYSCLWVEEDSCELVVTNVSYLGWGTSKSHNPKDLVFVSGYTQFTSKLKVRKNIVND